MAKLACVFLLAWTAQAELSMRVDSRIELLNVVQLLGGSARVNSLNQPYRANILSFFGPHRGHRAVQLVMQMEQQGFSFDAPPNLMMHLSEPPALAVRVPYSAYLLQRGGSRERLDTLVAALRDFAVTARFGEFLDANRGTFDGVEATVRSRLDGIDYIGKLEEYHGQRKDSYTVVLAPLLHSGGYGVSVANEVYSIIGPGAVTEGVADFGALSRIRDLLWHEFNHPFSNPLVEAQMPFLNSFSPMYELIRADMTAQAYTNWTTALSEHLVRAVHVRLTCRELGEEACVTHYRYERSRGFAYLDVLLARLREYEESRDRFPTLASMGQRLFDGFPEEWGRLMQWAQETGPLLVAAPRGIVKYRLYLLLNRLERESSDESVYAQGVTFRYEQRPDGTAVTVEPDNAANRRILIQMKYQTEADPELRGSFGLVSSAADGRQRVLYVREGSRASAMGFRIGDVLLDWSTLNRYPLDTANLIRLRDLPDEATATVRIVRNGEPVELPVSGSMR